MWWRDDVVGGDFGAKMMFTGDSTGVVVMTGSAVLGDARLAVLDAAHGETRFVVEGDAVPVVNDRVAQGVLRMTGDLHIEQLSLHDGSVIDATNLGISSLVFAASNRAGNVYMVAGWGGRAALWDTISGERSVFGTGASGHESVSFSADGRLMATAETDGSVTLWTVSSGPGGLRRLASLITFEDGDWAVVGADGRYDASDPADLEDLAWVMPDAPTEPVPLSVFYRDYYEPQLLPRLLAGETFEEIRSIADLDREQPRVEISVEPAGSSRVNVTVEVSRGRPAA